MKIFQNILGVAVVIVLTGWFCILITAADTNPPAPAVLFQATFPTNITTEPLGFFWKLQSTTDLVTWQDEFAEINSNWFLVHPNGRPILAVRWVGRPAKP